VSVEFDPRLCFVLMPMTDRFKGIYEHVIKPTVEDLELRCVYAGEIFGARPVMDDVCEYCAKARVVIADLTDRNTNVYYEAGYSHAFDRERIIFIAQKMEDVTFDVRHFRCIEYDPLPAGVDEFKTRLTQNLKAVLARQPGGLTVVTRTVQKTVEVPTTIDPQTQEALMFYRVVRSAERGHALVADGRASRLLQVLDAARNRRRTVTPIKPGRYGVVNVGSDYLLEVHAGPGSSDPIVGSIPPYATDLVVEGDSQEVEGQLWARVRFKGTEGWANGNYLARQEGSINDEIAARSLQIIMALKHEDMDTLATCVHPQKGVCFSPYAYVEPWHATFSADQIRNAFADDTSRPWGADDASGDYVPLTFREYYDRFIYDVDFARPDVVYFNHHFQSGHYINNIPEAYPGAVTVEYQFEGINPELHGFDWRGLRLVLEQQAGAWYLVGVTHDEMGV